MNPAAADEEGPPVFDIQVIGKFRFVFYRVHFDDSWRKVYDHLLNIYDLLFESVRSSEILIVHTKEKLILPVYDR